MKKSILFAGLLMVSAMFIGCNNDHSPETSTTKLWPAATISKDAAGIEKATWGYIDEKGQFAIQPAYTEANDFSCGYALVRVDTKAYFIDTKNNIQNMPESEWMGTYFYFDHVRYMPSTLWGMLNNKFETVLQPAYYRLGEMSGDGLVAYKQNKDGKYGYINKSGDVKINPMYDEADAFDAGYAVVMMGNSFGVINKSGEFTISLRETAMSNLGGERIGFYDKDNKKGGMMDAKGNIIVQAIYDAWNGIGFTDGDLMAVKSGDKWGFLDKNGKLKIATQYNYAMPFADDKAWVQRAEGSNWETIDVNGKTLITLGKNEMPNGAWRQGLCLVNKFNEEDYSEEYRYINEKGNTVYSWKVSGANNKNYNGGDDDEYYAPKKAAKRGMPDVNRMMKATKWGYRLKD